MPKSVSILGCGWLGFPLANCLIHEGFFVKGATTSPAKIPILKSRDIQPYLIHFNPKAHRSHDHSFWDADILFLNIPFKRDFASPYFYFEQMTSVVEQVIQQQRIKFIIFSSSTSIYPEHMEQAREGEPIIPENERQSVLKKVEDLLLSSTHFEATIIRFAGLYGPGRPIGKFLSGRKDLPDADQPANLIHLDDCIEIILNIIQKNIRREIFNACSDEHPSKKDLYIKAAQRLNLDPPTFSCGTKKPYKIVDNRKLKQMLNYTFKYPDPMKAL